MNSASDPGEEIREAGAAVAAAAKGPEQPVTQSKWYRWRKSGTALIAYLLDSEVHTFAFSVAANAIISFIPFVVLLYTLALSVFHSQDMVKIVDNLVNYFLPSAAHATHDQTWVTYYIFHEAVLPHPLVSQHGAQFFSLVMILISCTGIFLPLEVALNQAWGVKKSRNYLFNQTIAFGLALLMLGLAVACMVTNLAVDNALPAVFLYHTDNGVFRFVSGSLDFAWLAISTGIASILFFFSVYYILPNRKVPWRPVLRTSIITGVVWLLSRFIFVLVLPHLNLQSIYGPFFISVGLLFWAYISGLILFAGAQFSVARLGDANR
jgi:YihY family inner membrane protein